MNIKGINSGKPWTKSELDSLIQCYPVYGYRGVKVNHPPSSIHNKARRVGLRPPCNWRKLRGNAFVEKIPRGKGGRFTCRQDPEWDITPDEIRRRCAEIRKKGGGA